MGLVLSALAVLVLGLVVGRFIILVLPPLVCSLYFGGLAGGWWGNGLGDGWPFAFAALASLGIAMAAAGVALRRALDRPRTRARHQS